MVEMEVPVDVPLAELALAPRAVGIWEIAVSPAISCTPS
jgi:hypothetical protein